jgi:hypothetical protein
MKRAKPRRLFYRSGFTPTELDQLVVEVGVGALAAALARWTSRRSATPAE